MRPAEAARTGLLPIHAGNGPWPLHGRSASRAAEQAAAAAEAPHALMERAGLAVARLALALAPHARRIQIWAGPGNNGGDGLVAARHLQAGGRSVSVSLLADSGKLPPDASWALQQAQAAGVAVHTGLPDAASDVDFAIDGLLGLGALRAPEGTLAEAIDRINAGPAPVLAIDLPSGLDPDRGTLLGRAAVRAPATLALLTLKPGCHTALGRDHAGQVWLDTLGLAPSSPSAWLAGPAAWPRRPQASHKGSYGDVVIVGGAPGMAGAAWLAARSALSAGAGRVFCCLLDPAAPQLDPARPELMVRSKEWLTQHGLLKGLTVACGCGGGEAVLGTLPTLISRAGRLVLDADALNGLAADVALQTLLRARSARGQETLLTPHPLEAARLLQTTAAAVQGDRLRHAQELAESLACAVLLKGSGSIVAAPARLPRINPTGNAALASPGTGDVLAGLAAGLWSQQADAAAADIGSGAAWLHGRAADIDSVPDGAGPLRAGDLVERLALRRGL
jgi:hydroxyethylthiazole kinase-like uncharacterized protein yjeF